VKKRLGVSTTCQEASVAKSPCHIGNPTGSKHGGQAAHRPEISPIRERYEREKPMDLGVEHTKIREKLPTISKSELKSTGNSVQNAIFRSTPQG